MIIIMLGKPGSGKGTVGGLLSKQLQMPHVSSGELFRSYVKRAGDIGKKIDEYISKGNLVPDELAIKLVEKRLLEDDCKKGVILDGFPRTRNQAIELDKFLKKQNKKVDMAIELSLSDKEIIDRITKRVVCINKECREIYNLEFKPPKQAGICDICGSKLEKRDDDNIETIQKRLENYYETSANLTDYYKSQQLLYTVEVNSDSSKTVETVLKIECLEQYKKRKEE